MLDPSLTAPQGHPLTSPGEGPELPLAATQATTLGEQAASPWVLVRVTHSLRQLDGWVLTLISRGLTPVSRWLDGQAELYVPRQQLKLATAELDSTDAEERDARRAALADAALEQPPLARRAATGAVLVALLLLGFFAITGPRAQGAFWFAEGAADAQRVLQGEWWRAVTALTLHADSAHVISNVGIGTLVVGAVMRSEGVGFGAALVLAAGAAGNLINAWAHHALHSSVGFSTAVFGAVGLLGGLAYVQGAKRLRRARPAWTALAGSLALFALLGTGGERTDVFAHVFGLLSGLGLGLLVKLVGWHPRSALGQWTSGLGAAAAVLSAWLLALA